MQKLKSLLFVFVLSFAQISFSQQTPEIIPLPQSFKATSDTFKLENNIQIAFSDKSISKTAYFLQKELFERFNITSTFGKSSKNPSLNLVILSSKKFSPGAYSLKMSKKGISISAAEDEGLMNGIMSFLQLAESSKSNHIRCWEIDDYPLYAWRGLMLDESRHFFGKEKVKMLLDWMAYYKLNKFHWHLTDQPGWRIEIKKYPLLSLMGGIGDHSNPNTPTQFYSQEEIKEIVSYAAERNIEVIPEIDMPGHATAANRAYPQFSGGGSKNYPNFTFDPGNEGTYQYLTDILREVNVLFPSEMILLGGDEVSFGNQMWSENRGIQDLMKKHNLKNTLEVERYFMKRMADSLFQMNNTFLAWDEMAEAEFPTDKTIIFWWRHDHFDVLESALKNKYKVVLCPRIPFYFDFVQDDSHQTGRRWNGFGTLEQVYSFTSESVVSQKHKNQIFGIQANIWTEIIASEKRLDFMTFPRISALAEAAWSEKRNYPEYLNRLQSHLELYRKHGIYFFNPMNKDEFSEPKL